MKPLSEMTHYEVLEIGSEASPAEIERAYRVAQATWGEDALATYSLFEDGDLAGGRTSAADGAAPAVVGQRDGARDEDKGFVHGSRRGAHASSGATNAGHP